MTRSYRIFLGALTSRPNWGACEEAISDVGFPLIERAADAADQAEVDVDGLLEDAAQAIDAMHDAAESEDPGGHNDYVWRSFESDAIKALESAASRIMARVTG